MADAVMIDFPAGGVDAALYDQINAKVNPPGSPPAGLMFHCAGPSPDGGWRIVDVWESRATFDAFFQSKVMAAVAEIVGPEAMQQGPPPAITSWPMHNVEGGL
jgi:hypothetical protein